MKSKFVRRAQKSAAVFNIYYRMHPNYHKYRYRPVFQSEEAYSYKVSPKIRFSSCAFWADQVDTMIASIF